MKNAQSRNSLRIIGLLLCLGASYILCRFVLFDVHGMKQWPDILAGFSLIILLLALILRLRWMSATAAFGYIVGFFLGVLFNTDGYDPGGGQTNNMWIIWAVGLLACMAAGLVVDIAVRIKKSTQEH